MKYCSKCKTTKEDKDFYKEKQTKDGLTFYCKLCKIDINKKTYKKFGKKRIKKNYKEYRERQTKYQIKYLKDYINRTDKGQREKYLCRRKTSYYVGRGVIKKEVCNICGSKNSEKHHVDYKSPFNILWLCKKHHVELHNKLRNITL